MPGIVENHDLSECRSADLGEQLPGQTMLLWAVDADWLVLQVAGTVLEPAGRCYCGYAVETWLSAAPGLWIWEGSASAGEDGVPQLHGQIRRPTDGEIFALALQYRLPLP